MAELDLPIVREALDALIRGDIEVFSGCCTPDVVWEENTTVFPGMRARYEGREELCEWFREAVTEAWSDLTLERSELTLIAGQVVLDLEFRAHGKASGAETKLRIWQVFWLREGRISRRQLFVNEADARRAAARAA